MRLIGNSELTPYGMCRMSATHKLPTVNLFFDDIRIALRLSLIESFVLLSTFIIAFPASFINANLFCIAVSKSAKLKPEGCVRSQCNNMVSGILTRRCHA